MLRGARSLWRLVGIARTLQRHDALAPLQDRDLSPGLRWLTRLFAGRKAEGRPGQKLARALTDLGPSFIKLGQVLSTRADLLGEEMAADLSDLQDRLPAFPTAEAKRTIESELGQPLGEIFASFEDEPVSAASIAQVHFATTPEGAPVAVKVLRPGIEAAFERDLDFFTWRADLIERRQPKFRLFKPS
jgi:ubiquinone biosynthesis protein